MRKCLAHPTHGLRQGQQGAQMPYYRRRTGQRLVPGPQALEGCGSTRLISHPCDTALIPTHVYGEHRAGIRECTRVNVGAAVCARGQAQGWASLHWGEAEALRVGSEEQQTLVGLLPQLQAGKSWAGPYRLPPPNTHTPGSDPGTHSACTQRCSAESPGRSC